MYLKKYQRILIIIRSYSRQHLGYTRDIYIAEPTSLRLDFARALEAFVMDEVRLSPLPNGALTGSALE